MDDQKLLKFKTKMCSVARQSGAPICNFGPQCIFAHHENELRRDLSVHYYVGEMCPRILAGEYCPNANCFYAHRDIELLYHPDHYKTQLCVQAQQLGGCDKKQVCCFAHGQHELRQPMQRSTQLLQQHIQQQQSQHLSLTSPQPFLSIQSPAVANSGSESVPNFLAQPQQKMLEKSPGKFPNFDSSFGTLSMPNMNSFASLNTNSNPLESLLSPAPQTQFRTTLEIVPESTQPLLSNPQSAKIGGGNLASLTVPRDSKTPKASNLVLPTPMNANAHDMFQSLAQFSLLDEEVARIDGAAITLASQLAITVYTRSHPNLQLGSISDLSQKEFGETINMLKHQISTCVDAISWLTIERTKAQRTTKPSAFFGTSPNTFDTSAISNETHANSN